MSMIEQLIAHRDKQATELTAANRAVKDAQELVRSVTARYEASCVAVAKHEPTPFPHGAKLKRTELRRGAYQPGLRGGSNPDRNVVVRGVMTLSETTMNYRNHYPKVGEWFVLSSSGQTAYSLTGGWELDTEA